MDDLVMAYASNLSRGGMRLRTQQPMAIGSRVQVNIDLPDDKPPLGLTCEVVAVTQGEEPGRYFLGVKFLDPQEETRKRLEWYILNSDPSPGQFGAAAHTTPLDVLIVDDEKMQRGATSAPFRARGDHVTTAANGFEALAACLKSRPNVILTDVQMPGMDGWQLLRTIRSRANLRTVPVLFLTTLSGERERLLGYRLGVDDYLSKPPDPADLVARVDRAALRALQLSAAPAPEKDALRGDIEQVGLPSILSFLELERKTGLLRVGPTVNAQVYLREGRLVRIRLEGGDGLSAEQRFFRLMSLKAGRFEFTPDNVPPVEGELEASVSALLLEHARLTDESGRS